MKYLLKLNRNVTDNILDKLVEKHVKIEYVLTIQPIIIADIDDIDQIKGYDFIERIEEERFYEIQALNYLPNLRVNKLKKEGHAGSNAIIAVIDTGMGPDDSLEIYKSEITSNAKDALDAKPRNSLHGTIVGRIIKDIAPFSRIINLKIADANGEIRERSVLKALEWAYSNSIKIINMSIGKINDCEPDCITCGVVNQMVDEGFAIVTAIGNYGRNGDGITTCPANAEKSLAVGAAGINKDLAEYSSVAKKGKLKPDILAPGYVRIYGEEHTGTSFAAPYITGVIAGLSQNFDLNVIIESMKKCTTSIGLPFNMQGHGLINIEQLIGVLNYEKGVNQG